jgi:hypothetical protein
MRTNLNTKLLAIIRNHTEIQMSKSSKKSSKKSSPKCQHKTDDGVQCVRDKSITNGNYCRFHAARMAQYVDLDIRKELEKIDPILANELVLHTKNKLDPRVERLLLVNYHMPEQRTKEWYEYRNGIMTASPAACYVFITEYEYKLAQKGILCLNTAGRDIKKTDIGTKRANCFPGWKEQVERKCIGEKAWKGNRHTKHGVKYEPVITSVYERTSGTKVLEFGIMPHPTIDWIGASPDGITTDGRMVEIKAPTRDKLTDPIICQYWMQMQIQMEVCNLDECDFVEARINEYESKEAYLNDQFYDEEGVLQYHLNSQGNPKGIVLTIEKNILQGELDKMETEYVYPFPQSGYFQSQEDEEDWIKNWIINQAEQNVDLFISSDIRIKTSYYKIDEWRLHLVKRDKEWWNLRLPDFEEGWNTILRYRKEGVPDDLKPKPKTIKKPKAAKTEDTDYAFGDSDDEDDVDYYRHGMTAKWKEASKPKKPRYTQSTIPVLDLGFSNRKKENDSKYEVDVF